MHITVYRPTDVQVHTYVHGTYVHGIEIYALNAVFTSEPCASV